jgi:peptidoglycan/LPS O-acetylase OafA/YrhL
LVVGSIAAVIVVVAAFGIVSLWWLVGGNAAGWLTSLAAFAAAFFLAELLVLERRFLGLSTRGQRLVIGLAVVIAAGGSVGYALLPGTMSWYVFPLLALPVLLIVDWLRGDDESQPGPMDFSDGPWTAP